MKKHAILIADLSGEFAAELLRMLHSAGLVVSTCPTGVIEAQQLLSAAETEDIPTVAVLCELPSPAVPAGVRTVLAQARELWPTLPLVACAESYGALTPKQLLKAGFRAVAESPAQLPALLREVEENPNNEDEFAPVKPLADDRSFTLPKSLRNENLRDAFSLIASLHLAGNQKEAAAIAVEGLSQMIAADRWSIFVVDHAGIRGDAELELLATKVSTDIVTVVAADSAAPDPTDVARQAVTQIEPLKRAVRENWILALPLVWGDRVFGVAEATRRREATRSFSRAQLALVRALASPIAAALSNSGRVAEAERLSLTDELTRLHNARYLRQFLVNEMKRARRFASKISALFLDLDDFKTVNDLYGHLAGSHVLMEVASVILPSVRDTDCVVRYGGDEFVVILPETTLHEALRVADRIRGKIEANRFSGGRRLHIHLTSSVGVAVFPDEALSPHQLIACADRAMYAAKAANKNCVRATTPAQSVPVDNRHIEDGVDGAQFQRIPDEKFIS